MNGRTKVDLRQQKNGRVYAEGLTRVTVTSPEDVQHVMTIGARSRSVGAHDFNAHSSRSHLVMTVTIIGKAEFVSSFFFLLFFCLYLVYFFFDLSNTNICTFFFIIIIFFFVIFILTTASSKNKEEDNDQDGDGDINGGRKNAWSEPPPSSSAKQRVSRLHMIDLAGSERISKTAATGARLKEAQSINKSLSALGNVICALGKGGGGNHVPFRDSKLTHLLSNSLSGNSKVIMMLCVSPTQICGPETLCSLKFAQRCRSTKLGRAKKKTMQRGKGMN